MKSRTNNALSARLLASASIIGLVVGSHAALAQSASPPPPQTAQPAKADEEKGKVEKVTVTAQKRSQRLQDVPIAVSAFTSGKLDRGLIEDALDIQFNIPNTMLVGNDRLTIRGIGNNALSSTSDNGVAVLVNGSSVSYLPQNEFFDLERIEVLRGPQGTLYGRNTTGGAFNVITRKPNDEFGGDLYVQYGSFDGVKVHGAINIPISDNLNQRFAGFYLNRDGYTENVSTGNNIDGRDQYALRSSTQLLLGENTEANLVLGYFKEDSTRTRETKRLCKANAVLGCSPNELGFDSPNSFTTTLRSLLDLALPPAIFPNGTDIYAGAPNPADFRKVAADTDPSFKGEQFFGTLDLTHTAGSMTYTSLTGYSTFQTEQNIDYDNSDLPFRFLSPVTYFKDRNTKVTTDRLLTTDSFTAENRTFTQELRAASNFKGFFDFTAGAYYLNVEGAAAYEIWHPGIEFGSQFFGSPVTANHFANESPHSATEAWALFGEAYFKLSDATRLTLGSRYTEEDKEIRTRTIFLFAPPPFTEASRSWSQATYKVALDHKLTENSLLYGSVSTGYKGGGLNPGNSGFPDFEPETVLAYEIGSKNRFADGALQANFAAFYYDYTDLQLAQRIDTNAITKNSDAKVKGFEAELTWVPDEHWLFEGNLSLLDSEIGTFITEDPANPAQNPAVTAPVVQVDLSGNKLPYAPDYSFKLAAQYSALVSDGGWRGTARADYYYQDTYFSREFNSPNDKIDAWDMLDFQARATSPDENFEVQLFVKNVMDNDAITNTIVESRLVGRYRNARFLEPRTIGIGIQTRF